MNELMMDRNGVVLFNPRSASAKHRIPNSILQIGASIHGKRPYVFVDGNKEKDPYSEIARYLKTGQFKYFGSSVMPAACRAASMQLAPDQYH